MKETLLALAGLSSLVKELTRRDVKPCLGKDCQNIGVPMKGYGFYACPQCKSDIAFWVYLYTKGNLDKEYGPAIAPPLGPGVLRTRSFLD